MELFILAKSLMNKENKVKAANRKEIEEAQIWRVIHTRKVRHSYANRASLFSAFNEEMHSSLGFFFSHSKKKE